MDFLKIFNWKTTFHCDFYCKIRIPLVRFPCPVLRYSRFRSVKKRENGKNGSGIPLRWKNGPTAGRQRITSLYHVVRTDAADIATFCTWIQKQERLGDEKQQISVAGSKWNLNLALNVLEAAWTVKFLSHGVIKPDLSWTIQITCTVQIWYLQFLIIHQISKLYNYSTRKHLI